MKTREIESEWLRSLARGERPEAQSLKDHLLTVHRHYAGFTESCAGRCRDSAGRTSYEWLSEVPGDQRDGAVTILDLACGSGPLLAVCAKRYPNAQLIGIDMSPHELGLAKSRIAAREVSFHLAMAQDLSVVPTGSVDAVLCHWALTLMEPIEPVLSEVSRVLRAGGRFAAIVDGPSNIAPGYGEIDETIFDAVSKVAPLYGVVDIGDPRVRNAKELAELAHIAFPGANVSIETSVLHLSGSTTDVAREAAGFFYASFALPPEDHACMIRKLEKLMPINFSTGESIFALPVTRLTVTVPGSA